VILGSNLVDVESDEDLSKKLDLGVDLVSVASVRPSGPSKDKEPSAKAANLIERRRKLTEVEQRTKRKRHRRVDLEA